MEMMDKTWMDVLIYVIEAVVGVAMAVGIPYLFSLIKAKTKNEKAMEYISKAEGYLLDAVLMVKQTFVDSLKAEGKFDADAQAEAFLKARDAWAKMMSEEMKLIIINEVGDLDAWVQAKIEAAVIESKK